MTSRVRRAVTRLVRRGARFVLPRLDGGWARRFLALASLAGARRRVAGAVQREAERRIAAGERGRGLELVEAVTGSEASPVGTVRRGLTVLEDQGELDVAVRLAREAVRRPGLSDLDRWRLEVAVGRILGRAGAMQEAVEHLVAVVEARPERHDGWHALLVAAARLGDRELLGAHLGPESLSRLQAVEVADLLEILGREGLWDEGEEVARQASLTARQVRRPVGLALNAGRPATAEAFVAAVRGSGQQARAQVELGRLLERYGEHERATVAFEAAIEMAGERVVWCYLLGRARERSGRHEQARAAYERMWELDGAPEDRSSGVVAPLERKSVTGWIPAAARADAEVAFKVNGRRVAVTFATTPVTFADGSEHLEFSRSLRAVWSHAGAGDALEIEHDGTVLPIIGGGRRHEFPVRRASRVDELFAQLDAGSVINKYGKLMTSIRVNEEWQEQIFDLFHRLRDDISRKFDLELFPIYGTMLGAVREGDFIGHDNDFDTAYVSSRSEPEEVREEFQQLCRYLIDQGYELRPKHQHTHVRLPGAGGKLDIFYSWFAPDGRYQVSYGYHGPEVRRSPDFFRFRPERLGPWTIQVPQNAEDILAQLFGPGWRKPDPGFKHQSPTRVLDRRYRLDRDQVNALHWHQFYRDHEIDRASPFASFVAERLPDPAVVLELGCGTGRDSLFFARLGHTVVAADRSPEAIERARGAQQESGVAGVQFDVLDAASRQDVDRLLARAKAEDCPGGIVVYLRFFLHAVPEETQNGILASLVEGLEGGFLLCAEFRTDRDRLLPKVHDDHFRRYIDENDLADKLRERWGFDIDHLEARHGLSPYKGEDPHLARIIARQPTPGAAGTRPRGGDVA